MKHPQENDPDSSTGVRTNVMTITRRALFIAPLVAVRGHSPQIFDSAEAERFWFADWFIKTAKYAKSVSNPETFKLALKKNQDTYFKWMVKEGNNLWRRGRPQEITKFHRRAATWLAADTPWANL